MISWRRTRIPMEVNGETELDMYYGKLDDIKTAEVLNSGGGNSKSISNQYIIHWVIGICRQMTGNYEVDRQNLVEPTYKQKVQILKDLGVWKQIALEVMPSEVDVVDRENVYHIWEFEFPYSFMYDITPIYKEPLKYEGLYEGMEYHLFVKGGAMYIYFRPKTALDIITWRKKQSLKNFLLGEDATAVEIVQEEMLNKKYFCMIGFFDGRILDFGLA